jgi:general secretion pathway protein K
VDRRIEVIHLYHVLVIQSSERAEVKPQDKSKSRSRHARWRHQKSIHARRLAGTRPGQRGVALVMVLWVMALLAVLAVSFTGDARTHLLLARNQHESAQARSLAEAGIALGIAALLVPSPEAPVRLDGEMRELTFGDGAVRIALQDEAGKIDLNFGPKELFRGLFETAGIAPEDSRALSEILQEWRTTRVSDLVAAGTQGRVQAFASIEELALVPGMTRSLREQILPFVTVHSRRARIDPLTAPREVLQSVPGVDQVELQTFLEARTRLGRVIGGLPPLQSATRYTAHGALQAVTVRAEGRIPNGVSFVREAVIAIGRTAGVPYTVLAWR